MWAEGEYQVMDWMYRQTSDFAVSPCLWAGSRKTGSTWTCSWPALSFSKPLGEVLLTWERPPYPVTLSLPCRELPFRGTWLAEALRPGQTQEAGSAVDKHQGRSERDCIPIALLHLFLLLLPARLSITRCTSQAEQPISPRSCACVCEIIFLLCQKAKPACEEAINLSPCLMLLFCCTGLQRTCWNEPLCCANAS